jgi:hypothetical protein
MFGNARPPSPIYRRDDSINLEDIFSDWFADEMSAPIPPLPSSQPHYPPAQAMPGFAAGPGYVQPYPVQQQPQPYVAAQPVIPSVSPVP